METNKTKLIIKIVVAVVIGIIILAGRCAQSKAASEFGFATQAPATTNIPNPDPTPIFFTPDPNASWDDYISENPILTPEPYVPDTPEPMPDPSELPVMGTVPNTAARFTAYRLAPEIEDGEITYLFQQLLPNYTLHNPALGNWSCNYTKVNNWYKWDASSVPNGHFVINDQCGLINLVDNYICGQWNVYFANSQSVGSGLDYGTEVTATVKWPLAVSDYHTGQIVTSIPVAFMYSVILDNGVTFFSEPNYTTTRQLYSGISIKIPQDFENRKIYRISIFSFVGMDKDSYQNLNPDTREPARVYLVTNNYLEAPFTLQVNVNTNPTWQIGDKIFNFIQTIPSAIGSTVQGLFLPTSNDLNAWVQSHLSSSLESGSPVNRYWEFYLALCNKFINPSYSLDPYLVMPSFSFNVNGQKQTIWQEYRFRLKDADITFSDGTTLFYWSRLVTSIIITSHWIGNFAYSIFMRVYHIHDSAPAHAFEGGGGESRGGGVGRS